MIANRARADDATIAAAKTGSPAAWRALYDSLGGRVLGWARAQTISDAALDADDIANETWMTAARRIADFNGSAEDFAGWLFVIARNLTVNANRRSMRRRTSPTEDDPRDFAAASGAGRLDETVAVDAMDWIARLIAPLSPRERDVVALIDIAGLDTAAASEVLGASQSAVRVARHRALRKLRAIVEAEPSGSNSA